jgi:hypothetical protein
MSFIGGNAVDPFNQPFKDEEFEESNRPEMKSGTFWKDFGLF